MLTEKRKVCVMFGEQFCIYIQNNTAPEGAFIEVMIMLKNLRMEDKANARKGNQILAWFDLNLESWGA